MSRRVLAWAAGLLGPVVVGAAGWVLSGQLPAMGAGALLHPARRPVVGPPPAACIDDVSPVRAAAKITAPVLLIHGEADIDTPPEHSRRVFAALAASKRLIMVPGAGHNGSLRPEVWDEISRWIDSSTRPGTS